MEITCKDLTQKYNWEEIQPVLTLLYPEDKREIAEYQEAYQKFSTTIPRQTKMRIIIEENKYPTGGSWYDIYGKDGTLVKDAFPEVAHKHLQDRLEQEQGYGLMYHDWEEMAGMAIDSATLKTIPEKDIVSHVLVEITRSWHTEEQSWKVNEELQAIKEGKRQALLQKEFLGSTGFLQKWTEKENGWHHGWYTTYWPGGNVIAQRGIVVDGIAEGVWTYWDKNGKITKQVRCWCDRPLETKLESPWWDDAKDQVEQNFANVNTK